MKTRTDVCSSCNSSGGCHAGCRNQAARSPNQAARRDRRAPRGGSRGNIAAGLQLFVPAGASPTVSPRRGDSPAAAAARSGGERGGDERRGSPMRAATTGTRPLARAGSSRRAGSTQGTPSNQADTGTHTGCTLDTGATGQHLAASSASGVDSQLLQASGRSAMFPSPGSSMVCNAIERTERTDADRSPTHSTGRTADSPCHWFLRGTSDGADSLRRRSRASPVFDRQEEESTPAGSTAAATGSRGTRSTLPLSPDKECTTDQRPLTQQQQQQQQHAGEGKLSIVVELSPKPPLGESPRLQFAAGTSADGYRRPVGSPALPPPAHPPSPAAAASVDQEAVEWLRARRASLERFAARKGVPTTELLRQGILMTAQELAQSSPGSPPQHALSSPCPSCGLSPHPPPAASPAASPAQHPHPSPGLPLPPPHPSSPGLHRTGSAPTPPRQSPVLSARQSPQRAVRPTPPHSPGIEKRAPPTGTYRLARHSGSQHRGSSGSAGGASPQSPDAPGAGFPLHRAGTAPTRGSGSGWPAPGPHPPPPSPLRPSGGGDLVLGAGALLSQLPPPAQLPPSTARAQDRQSPSGPPASPARRPSSGTPALPGAAQCRATARESDTPLPSLQTAMRTQRGSLGSRGSAGPHEEGKPQTLCSPNDMAHRVNFIIPLPTEVSYFDKEQTERTQLTSDTATLSENTDVLTTSNQYSLSVSNSVNTAGSGSVRGSVIGMTIDAGSAAGAASSRNGVELVQPSIFTPAHDASEKNSILGRISTPGGKEAPSEKQSRTSTGSAAADTSSTRSGTASSAGWSMFSGATGGAGSASVSAYGPRSSQGGAAPSSPPCTSTRQRPSGGTTPGKETRGSRQTEPQSSPGSIRSGLASGGSPTTRQRLGANLPAHQYAYRSPAGPTQVTAHSQEATTFRTTSDNPEDSQVGSVAASDLPSFSPPDDGFIKVSGAKFAKGSKSCYLIKSQREGVPQAFRTPMRERCGELRVGDGESANLAWSGAAVALRALSDDDAKGHGMSPTGIRRSSCRGSHGSSDRSGSMPSGGSFSSSGSSSIRSGGRCDGLLNVSGSGMPMQVSRRMHYNRQQRQRARPEQLRGRRARQNRAGAGDAAPAPPKVPKRGDRPPRRRWREKGSPGGAGSESPAPSGSDHTGQSAGVRSCRTQGSQNSGLELQSVRTFSCNPSTMSHAKSDTGKSDSVYTATGEDTPGTSYAGTGCQLSVASSVAHMPVGAEPSSAALSALRLRRAAEGSAPPPPPADAKAAADAPTARSVVTAASSAPPREEEQVGQPAAITPPQPGSTPAAGQPAPARTAIPP